MNGFLPDFWNKGDPIDLLGDATDQRFRKTFELLARHDDLWYIAFVFSFPNPVLGSEQVANEIIRFSEQTGKMIVGTLLGGDSMQRGRDILLEHQLPSFEELDFIFPEMGRVLWQQFR